MRIVVLGLTITSSWGNGHATTYRSLLMALARRGHSIHFVEKDVEWYRNNRDLPSPSYCTVDFYEHWEDIAAKVMSQCMSADVVLIGSYFADAISATQSLLSTVRCPLIFYDIDTPITLKRLRESGKTEYLEAALIPQYAAYLSFTGGPALTELEQGFGARHAIPFFCSVDADLYRPTQTRSDFRCDFSYLGTYAVDRQPKLMSLLNDTAALLPEQKFLVAGPQYPAEIVWSSNVARLVHVPPPDHPALYSSCRFTLNLTREDMVKAGYSPSVRLFEASACGAAIISDEWPGLEDFLTPGEEILIAHNAAEVTEILRGTSDATRKSVGKRARERILCEHTAEHRARQFEQIVSDCTGSTPEYLEATLEANAGRGSEPLMQAPQS